MTLKPAAGEVKFLGVATQLPSKDLAATKAWYEGHLGFRELGRWQDHDFLILDREGVRLHFWPTDQPQLAEVGSFYLRVSGDIDGLWRGLTAGGVDAHDAPEDKPYGMREFTAHDADGRHVLIGKPLERGP